MLQEQSRLRLMMVQTLEYFTLKLAEVFIWEQKRRARLISTPIMVRLNLSLAKTPMDLRLKFSIGKLQILVSSFKDLLPNPLIFRSGGIVQVMYSLLLIRMAPSASAPR